MIHFWTIVDFKLTGDYKNISNLILKCAFRLFYSKLLGFALKVSILTLSLYIQLHRLTDRTLSKKSLVQAENWKASRLTMWSGTCIKEYIYNIRFNSISILIFTYVYQVQMANIFSPNQLSKKYILHVLWLPHLSIIFACSKFRNIIFHNITKRL